MKPHINIGTIGHIDHGKTTLTAAISATLANRPEPILVSPKSEDLRGLMIESKAMEYTPAPIIVDPPRRRSPVMPLFIMATMAGMLGMTGAPSAADVRNSPDREKTPEDLERMAAAQRKRDRKAARKGSTNTPNHHGTPHLT